MHYSYLLGVTIARSLAGDRSQYYTFHVDGSIYTHPIATPVVQRERGKDQNWIRGNKNHPGSTLNRLKPHNNRKRRKRGAKRGQEYTRVRHNATNHPSLSLLGRHEYLRRRWCSCETQKKKKDAHVSTVGKTVGPPTRLAGHASSISRSLVRESLSLGLIGWKQTPNFPHPARPYAESKAVMIFHCCCSTLTTSTAGCNSVCDPTSMPAYCLGPRFLVVISHR